MLLPSVEHRRITTMPMRCLKGSGGAQQTGNTELNHKEERVVNELEVACSLPDLPCLSGMKMLESGK